MAGRHFTLPLCRRQLECLRGLLGALAAWAIDQLGFSSHHLSLTEEVAGIAGKGSWDEVEGTA